MDCDSTERKSHASSGNARRRRTDSGTACRAGRRFHNRRGHRRRWRSALMTQSVIEDIRWHMLRVTPKTIWTFIEVIDAAERIGTGEATLTGREPAMRGSFEHYKHVAIDHAPAQVDLGAARSVARTLSQFAVISGLDQAVWDLAAQQSGISVSAMLGERRRDCVAVYANINRGITDRTADGFEAHARRAVEDGCSVLKIAPFDGIELYGDSHQRI